MNLKVRLAILYSLSVFIILVASAISIYVVNENFRKKDFSKQLIIEASESYQIYFRFTEPNSAILQELSVSVSHSLPHENIIIFDSATHVLYASPGSRIPTLPIEYFYLSKNQQPYKFKRGNREAVLLYRKQKGKDYYVLASGTDVYGRIKNHNLKIILACTVLGGIILSGLMAFFYVRHAIKPLEELKEQIERINEDNLKDRITLTRSNNNEVWQIAQKFNAMLDRLEHTFEQRKNFVQHASHELRTPLANMLSQTEAALSQSKTAAEYRAVLESLKEDQHDMIDLTNSLLILSRHEKTSAVLDPSPIRVDELLYETVDLVNQVWPETIVTIDFETVPDNENLLTVEGNELLIKSAMQNLVKNAAKYAEDHRVRICINPAVAGITLTIDNVGKQLSAEEQARLFIPFFRGENAQNKKGHGLGLSIVERIIRVHKGSISYQALENNINRFTLFLPSR